MSTDGNSDSGKSIAWILCQTSENGTFQEKKKKEKLVIEGANCEVLLMYDEEFLTV